MKPESTEESSPVVDGPAAESAQPVTPEPSVTPEPTVIPESAMPTAEPVTPSPSPTPVPPQPTVVTPYATPPVQYQPQPQFQPQPQASRRRKLLWVGLAALVVAGAAGGYVFGLYLPNKPDHVWGLAFSRTGDALDTLVNSAVSADTTKAYQKLQLTGDLNVKSGSASFRGSLDGKFDPTTAQGTVKISAGDSEGQKYDLGIDLRSQRPKDALYPDSYLRLSGLKALGLDAYLPGIGDYDNKWVYISGDYVKSLVPAMTDSQSKDTNPQLTRDDVAEVAQTLTRVTKQYVFTDDQSKAVVINKEFLGKDQSEGASTYHYKAGLNKDHAQAYCVALGNALLETKAYKKFNAVDGTAGKTDPKTTVTKDCADSTGGIKDTSSFELWVERGHDLIQKVKVADPSEPGNYVEVGQTYKGGTTIPQFARYHSDKDKLDIAEQATLDTTTKAVKLTVSGREQKTATSEGFDISLNLNASPYNGTVPFDRPADAVPLPEVLKRFGIDPSQFTSPSSSLLNSSNGI